MVDTFKMSASLYLFGQDLEPADVTEITKVEPSRTQRRADKTIGQASGKTGEKKLGLWSVGRKMDGSSVSHVVDAAFAEFETIKESVLDIPGVTAGKLDVFAVAETPDGRSDCNFRFTPEQVAKLAKLNVGIEITISSFPKTPVTESEP